MRIFVGVELPDEVKDAASLAADALGRRLADAGLRLDAKWVPRDNLHITLWFIGEVIDDRVRAIQDALAPASAVPAFDVRLAGLGAFPLSGAPRVFWIGLRSGADGMTALNAEVGARLAPLGCEPERRPYSAHVTIARAKELASRSDAAGIRRIAHSLAADAGLSRVSAVTLFRSRLSPKGAAYEPLLRVPLR